MAYRPSFNSFLPKSSSMSGKAFSKVTATTSMTHRARRQSKRIGKQLANGLVPDEPIPAQEPSRRAGLRTRGYTYNHYISPQIVQPRAGQSTPLAQVPIPHLGGQDDIPDSGSESGAPTAAALVLGQQPIAGQVGPVYESVDRPALPASTVIEDDDGSSSSSASDEGDDDQTMEVQSHIVNTSAVADTFA
ncbi:hypothetical protein BDV93DRAFT_513598 [Ceratobasidium sp. AG-I]|nr:hypothetical protein BDV93DRAFT_513598 [Ceratobasidium sp. AG-I]